MNIMTLRVGRRSAAALAIAVLLAGPAPAQGLGERHAGERHAARPTASPPSATAEPSTTADPGPTAAGPSQALLDRLQEEDDRILGVQGRIADAQDRTTNLIGLMIGIGLVESVLFGVILLITLRASRATISAARALPILERAYVFLANDAVLAHPAELGASAAVGTTLNVALANHGRTPAVVRWINLNHQYLAELPEGVYEDHERHGAGLVLGPGETLALPAREMVLARGDWEKAQAGHGGVYLHGRIVYSDIFGAPHETLFCRRYDIGAGAFTLVDSEALNRND
jgi:hypothetical protein